MSRTITAFHLAYGILRNRDEAEDSVEEAAMKAWRKRATFRAAGSAEGTLRSSQPRRHDRSR
jgi:DNA-directed RNA polymerase specialized sigma24 family protein